MFKLQSIITIRAYLRQQRQIPMSKIKLCSEMFTFQTPQYGSQLHDNGNKKHSQSCKAESVGMLHVIKLTETLV